jgi:hypothetical protein
MSRPMSVQLGPDGQRPAFNGTAWVSQDGRHFWNGAAWQPFASKSTRPSGLVIVLAIVVVAIGGYILVSALGPHPFEGDGVSNTKIDSRTEIEFDYRRSSTCSNLTFEYKFFDSGGKQVDVFDDATGGQVAGGATHHFDIKADPAQPIDSRAVRFEADATCHD